MKNVPRQSHPLSLLDATKRNSSMLSGAIRVAMGFFCICSATAFAGDGANESAAPPPPANTVPTDLEAQLSPEQGKAYYDRFVTGDWGGWRTQLHNWGIDFNLDYYSEMAGNVSGGKDNFSGFKKGFGQSWAYADQFLLGLDLDFQKLVGWEGGSFRAYFTKRDGDSLSAYTNPAPLQQYQQIFGRGQTWRISDLWFKQKFANDVVEWKVGLIPVGEEFGNFYSYPFESLAFCAGTPGNLAGFSQFNFQ
jgi:carbohydrate-selective porin OprB